MKTPFLVYGCVNRVLLAKRSSRRPGYRCCARFMASKFCACRDL